MPVPRVKELNRRRKRRAKLRRLREQYKRAKTPEAKAKLQQKIVRVSPTAKIE